MIFTILAFIGVFFLLVAWALKENEADIARMNGRNILKKNK